MPLLNARVPFMEIDFGMQRRNVNFIWKNMNFEENGKNENPRKTIHADKIPDLQIYIPHDLYNALTGLKLGGG